MPLVAVALLIGTLLQSAIPALSAGPLFAPTPRPSEQAAPPAGSGSIWVAPHVETALWSASGARAEAIGTAHQWAPLQVLGKAEGHRLPVWDPATRRQAWVQAGDVGPIDPSLLGSEHLPPVGRRLAWTGAARITMYTCVELGGCAPTASGIWPEPGVVAVDPNVIPLGSTVWVQGLGTFLAADTGSLVRGAHLDVFSLSYSDALAWGVQERAIFVFEPD